MKPIRSLFDTLLSFVFLQRRHLILFFNGFILATLCYFYIEDNYESQLFTALSHRATSLTGSENPSKTQLAKSSLALTYELGQSRRDIFNKEEISSFKSDVISPVTYDLLSTKGACGSYSMILSRLLEAQGIDYRIAQMKVGNDYGAHILVEAKLDNRWVVLDPSYNLFFTTPDGKMASYTEVAEDWAFYQKQVPEHYNLKYKYEGVRYTNWNKIPVVLPFLKQVLSFFIGEEAAETFSLRSLFLRKFHILFIGSLIIYLISLLLIIRRQIRLHASRMSLDPSLLFPKKSERSTTLSSV